MGVFTGRGGGGGPATGALTRASLPASAMGGGTRNAGLGGEGSRCGTGESLLAPDLLGAGGGGGPLRLAAGGGGGALDPAPLTGGGGGGGVECCV